MLSKPRWNGSYHMTEMLRITMQLRKISENAESNSTPRMCFLTRSGKGATIGRRCKILQGNSECKVIIQNMISKIRERLTVLLFSLQYEEKSPAKSIELEQYSVHQLRGFSLLNKNAKTLYFTQIPN